MKKLFFIATLSMLWSNLILSQGPNLVPGFNAPLVCPTGIGQYSLTPPWDVPANHTGTPDYMHACNSGVVSTPSNSHGYQVPYTAPAYYGIITYGGNLREYLQVQLTSKLKKNSIYELGMYVSLADNYKYATNQLGIHVSANPPSGSGSTLPISGISPQAYSTGVITNSSGWTLISANYLASGTEEYISIGNFQNDLQTNNATVNAGSSFEFAYYYIDEVFVRKIAELFWVEADTAICKGDTAAFRAYGSSSYSWVEAANPGTILSSDSFFQVAPTTTTTYLAYGTNDTIAITVDVQIPSPVEIGNYIELCEGDMYIFDAYTFGATYIWDNGSTEATRTVNATGNYWVEVTDGLCTTFDDADVEVISIPDPMLDPSLTLCDKESHTIDIGYLPNVSYVWSDGSTNSSFTTGSTGYYWVKIIKSICSEVFTTYLDFLERPVTDLPSDTTICDGQTLNLEIEGSYSCIWSTGSDNCTVNINEEGSYTVTATNVCGSTQDEIEVFVSPCTCFTVIPNTFSPNGDGKNDVFSPLSNCEMKDFNFQIFHRSGKLVFQTNKLSVGWDGRFNLTNMPTGAYVYLVEYSYDDPSEEPVTLKGSFNLLR